MCMLRTACLSARRTCLLIRRARCGWGTLGSAPWWKTGLCQAAEARSGPLLLLCCAHPPASLSLLPPLILCSYAAPENLRSQVPKHYQQLQCPLPSTARYDGMPADVWSCGVVLFVMMYGYTPWDAARETSFEFRMYKVCSSAIIIQCSTQTFTGQ